MVVYNVNEQVFDAITEGNLYEVQRLFVEKRKHIDLNYHNKNDNDKNTFLIQACKCNQYYIAQLLIIARAKVNSQNANGETALIYACKSRNIELVKLLLNNDADVNMECKFGNISLCFPCHEDYLSVPIAKILIEHNANIYKQNIHGRTPLMLACESGSVEIVELLLNAHHLHTISRSSSSINRSRSSNYISFTIGRNSTNRSSHSSGHSDRSHSTNRSSHSSSHSDRSHSSNSSHSSSYHRRRSSTGSYSYMSTQEEGSNNSFSNIYESDSNNTIHCKGLTGCINLKPKPECNKRSYTNLFKPFISSENRIPNYIEMKDKKGDTAFIIACKVGNIDIVKLLMEHGANILTKNKNKSSGFTYACRFEYIDLVQLLLSYRINVNELFGEDLTTALIIVTSKNNIDLVRLLLEHNANPNIQKKYGRTALMHACWTGNIEIVKLLLQYHADVNLQNDCGDTALMYANKSRNLEVVRLILNHDANINVTNQDDETVLMMSIKELDYAIEVSTLNNLPSQSIDYYKMVIYLLLKYGADINFANGKGYTPLMYACLMSQEEEDVVELLLEYRANVNLQNYYGDSALMLACRSMHAKTVQLLLENGADITIKNISNETAFHYACKNGDTQVATFSQTQQNTEIIELLLKHVPDNKTINCQDQDGNTALMIACEKGYYDTVDLFLKYDAHLNLENRDGNTAIMMASRYGRNRTIQNLIAHKGNINAGIIRTLLHRKFRQPVSTKFIKEELYLNEVNLNHQNKKGQTALMIAIQNKCMDTFAYIFHSPLSCYINVNLVNQEGDTLFHCLSKEAHVPWKDFCQYYHELCQLGADITIKNNKKKTAIYYAKNRFPDISFLGIMKQL